MRPVDGRIVVVSTQRDAGPLAARCVESVALQEEPHEHVLVDDGSTEANRITAAQAVALWRVRGAYVDLVTFKREENRAALQNFYQIVQSLEPSAIVCCVDGDDFLLPGTLATVRRYYDQDPDLMLTYGQFCYEDMNPGWATPYPTSVILAGSYRADIWRATHLKTFRAGLFQQIKKADLMVAGNTSQVWRWVERATDLAMMFPMLEMAEQHARFVPETLYCYSGPRTPAEPYRPGSAIYDETQRIRNMPRYQPLTRRPW